MKPKALALGWMSEAKSTDARGGLRFARPPCFWSRGGSSVVVVRAMARSVLMIALASASLLAGCASSPPSSFYSLSPLPETRTAGIKLSPDGPAIGIGPVVFPRFLDRPQFVSRDGENRLVIDEFHRWGGTLQDDFLRVIGENLAYLLGTSRVVVLPSDARFTLDYRLSADVLSFEGVDERQATLKLRWMITDPSLTKVYALHESVYQTSLPNPEDPGSLAAALSKTLAAFSRDLADLLRTLPENPPPVKANEYPY